MEDYKILDKEGEGAFANVFKVEHKKTHKIYAMKTINAANDPDLFKKEVNILKDLNQLKHQNIVKYEDSFADEEQRKYVIIMEYCLGGTLKEMINGRKGVKFKQSKVIRLLYEIVQGLKYIHEMKIIHRDLKPANIFLGNDGYLKIGDFGISRVLNTTHVDTLAGTLGYMSPEILKNEPYDFSTDIWSLGCIAYELCCLEPLFTERSIYDAVQNIANAKYDASMINDPEYCEELRILISSMLNNDRSERPTALQILGSYVLTGNIMPPQKYFVILYENAVVFMKKKKKYINLLILLLSLENL